MRFSDPVKIAYRNLWAAKFRSFLTILGIIIGIASVIIIMAIGTSAQELILDQVRGIGANLVGVLPGASDEKGPPAQVFGVAITTLKYEDYKAIIAKSNVPNVAVGSAYVNGNDTVQFENTNKTAGFTGTTASYLDVETAEVEKGRFFTQEEDVSLARVAVFGADLAKDLFPNNVDPIGKRIKIGKDSFSVVGVLKKRGSTAFSSQDTSVFVPLFTAQKQMLGINYLNFVRLKIDAAQNIDRAIADVKTTLRARHNIKKPSDDDFTVRDQRTAVSTISNITNILKYFLSTIAAISLVVGGVGIMNTMLITIHDRVQEIGLRRSIGAKKRDVLVQFLIESVIITLTGGIIGIIAGVLVALAAAVVIQALGYHWPFIVTPSSIIVATIISVLVGIFFGIYPARKAAALQITEALRYE